MVRVGRVALMYTGMLLLRRQFLVGQEAQPLKSLSVTSIAH